MKAAESVYFRARSPVAPISTSCDGGTGSHTATFSKQTAASNIHNDREAMDWRYQKCDWGAWWPCHTMHRQRKPLALLRILPAVVSRARKRERRHRLEMQSRRPRRREARGASESSGGGSTSSSGCSVGVAVLLVTLSFAAGIALTSSMFEAPRSPSPIRGHPPVDRVRVGLPNGNCHWRLPPY